MNPFKQYVTGILSIVGRVIPKLVSAGFADILGATVKKEEDGSFTATVRGKGKPVPVKEQEAAALNAFRSLVKMEKESGGTLGASLGFRPGTLSYGGPVKAPAVKTVPVKGKARKVKEAASRPATVNVAP